MTNSAANQSSRGSPLNWIRYTLEFLALVLFTVLMTILPWGIVWRFGRGLGYFLGRWIPIRKEVVRKNLERAFPELDTQQIDQLVHGVFGHWGESFISAMKLWTLSDAKILRLVEGQGFPEFIRQRNHNQRPLLFFTGHFGSWEMAGRYIGLVAGQTSAIYRIQRNPLADSFLSWLRQRRRMVLVDSWSSMSNFIKALKEVGNMCIVGDQYKGRQGVTVDFFGLPSPSPKGVAVLAQRTPADVVFLTMPVKRGRCFMRWEIVPLDRPDKLDEQWIRNTVAVLMHHLETAIRENPEQYFWFHKRWRNIDRFEAARIRNSPSARSA